MGSRGSSSRIASSTINGAYTIYSKVPKGWKKIEGATTAPFGYEWVSNGKGYFSGEREQALVPSSRPFYDRVYAKDGWFVAKDKENGAYLIQSRGLGQAGLNRVIKAYKENGKVSISDADKSKVPSSVISAIKNN